MCIEKKFNKNGNKKRQKSKEKKFLYLNFCFRFFSISKKWLQNIRKGLLQRKGCENYQNLPEEEKNKTGKYDHNHKKPFIENVNMQAIYTIIFSKKTEVHVNMLVSDIELFLKNFNFFWNYKLFSFKSLVFCGKCERIF